MDNIDSFIDKFFEDHKELFNEAKYALLFDVINQMEAPEEVKKTTRECLNVFHKHDVDPDIVVEVLNVISAYNPAPEQKPKSNISEDELTKFVDYLNKRRKNKDDQTKA